MKIGRIAVAAGLLTAVVAHSGSHATEVMGGFYTGLGAGFGWRNYVGDATVPANAFNPALAAPLAVKQKLKKGQMVFLLFGGYDFAFDSFLLGFELQFGYHLGKMKKAFNVAPNGAGGAVNNTEFSSKASPYIGTLLRVGCTFSGVTVCAVGGVRFVHHKGRIRDTDNRAAAGGAPAFDASAKKWACHPCIGASLQYEFYQGFFARLDYLHSFKSKVKTKELKYSDDIITLGAGVRF
jgi:hypothetical protein